MTEQAPNLPENTPNQGNDLMNEIGWLELTGCMDIPRQRYMSPGNAASLILGMPVTETGEDK